MLQAATRLRASRDEAVHAKLLINWLIGSMHKAGAQNSIVPTGLMLQSEYPLPGKTLYRAVRIPEQDGVVAGAKLALRLTKKGIDVSSWSESMPAAIAVFNKSKFYDPVDGMTAVIVSSKIPPEDILFSYKTLDEFMRAYLAEHASDTLSRQYSTLRKKFAAEKEYVVRRLGNFDCVVVKAG